MGRLGPSGYLIGIQSGNSFGCLEYVFYAVMLGIALVVARGLACGCEHFGELVGVSLACAYTSLIHSRVV